MTIGEKIKIYRKRLGFTQTELGAKLGVLKDAVSKWETGRVTAIPTQKLFDMAELFHIPLSELIDDSDVISRQDPYAERTATIEYLKELNMYISPAYDEGYTEMCDFINNVPPERIWEGYLPMLGEHYTITETRLNEGTKLFVTLARVMFGPEDHEDTRTILTVLLKNYM